MKRIPLIAGAVCLCAAFFSTTASAQDWSPQQKEVWARVQECTGFFVAKNFDAMSGCVHDRFSGWLYGEPVPRTKTYFNSVARYMMENSSVATYDMRPVSILVVDDMAVVHYYLFMVFDGSPEVSQDRWTDVLVKEGGVWRWIADHGGTLPSKN